MRHAGLSQSTGGHARARLRSHDRLFFRHSAGSARDTRRARQACQAGPARLPGLAKPARATPPRPPATRHRAPGIHPGGSRAAARRPAGGRSRNVADGAPDRPAGADGSGPRGRGVACRTGANESGFRPGAATATWRRRVASGARPARGGAVGGRASVAHRGAAPRRPRLPPARQAGASNRPGAGPASHRQRLPGSATRARARARQRTSSRPIRCPCG